MMQPNDRKIRANPHKLGQVQNLPKIQAVCAAALADWLAYKLLKGW